MHAIGDDSRFEYLPVLICRKMKRNGRSALKTADRDLFNSTIAKKKDRGRKLSHQLFPSRLTA